MNLAAGQVVGGDFELVRPLGEGGMGVVWLAEERPLGRKVALKVMRPADSRTRASRFEREARALAALNHPSILSVLRTGIDAETGLHYIATPAILLTPEEIRHLCDEVLCCPYPAWLDNRGSDSGSGGSGSRGSDSSEPSVSGSPLTLADLLDGGKALPEVAVARMARDLAGALAAAHAAGILHRDVKPSNILFDAAGRALLADFGLAKFTAANGAGGAGESPVLCDSLSLDGTGNPKFLGTPSYAAPEAFKKGVAATPALDWYSLGAVLYETLTGNRPRSLRAPSSYDREHISRAWDPLLGDLLEPDPARRLADPAVFLRRLARVGRRPRRIWPAFALAGCAALAAALWISGAGSRKPTVAAGSGSREPPDLLQPLRGVAEAATSDIPQGLLGLAKRASPMPPRLAGIWMGEYRGPLQRLNTYAMPVVDDLVAQAIGETDDETRRLFAEGDAAWIKATKHRTMSREWEEGLREANADYSKAAHLLKAVSSGGDDPAAGVRVARAAALARLAWTHVITAHHGAADAHYADALAAIEPLVEKDGPRFAPLKSWLLAERAYMKCMEGRFEESVPDLTEALALWDFNTMRSWPGCAIQEAILLASLGGMRGMWFKSITEQENPEEKRAQKEKALDAITRAIALADEIMASTNSPSNLRPFTDFLAGCNYIRGEVCDSLHRRQESLEAYERACALWKSLGKEYDLTYCQALGRLTAKLYAMEETARSVEVGAELLAIVKPYAERNRAAYGQQYMVALRNQFMGLMTKGDTAGAEAVAEEILAFEGKSGGNAPAAK